MDTGRKAPQKEKAPVVLEHINKIEDPNLAGTPVTVEAVVSSTSIAYLIPKHVEVDYEDKDGNMQHVEREFDAKDPMNVKLVGVNEGTKQRRLNSRLRTGKEYVKDLAHRSVYRIRVRPPVFTLEKRGEKIVDEKGFEYKAHDIYITADKAVSFQPSSLIKVEGLTLPNPRTQKTTLLAYKTEFPEEIQAYNIEKLQLLKSKFKGWTVKQRLDWILENFEIYSQIIGRRNLAQAGFMVYFTPTWLRFNGDLQRGWGNGLIIGDTTVGKSENQRKMISLLNAGMLITAETASTVGLTGTATQVEKEGWFVDWGFLVLLDRKLLAIDGAHKLSPSNWAALAEAERSGVVAIAKAAKNSAYARTRQIKIANPVDKEADRYSTMSLASFLYPCKALTTMLDRVSIARLDVAVFADQRDVAAEKINKKFMGKYDKDLLLLSEVLRWCWSSTAKVKFTETAIVTLLTEATIFYKEFFCEQIPLVSIDMKWKLARLSVALAYLTLSTTDFETLTVTEDHVNAVVDFLRTEYSQAGLNALAKELKIEALSPEDVLHIVTNIINETKGTLTQENCYDIFKFIVLQGHVTKDQLKTKFSLADKSQLRPLLAVLDNEKLIKRGRGFFPTPKLVQAHKIIISPEFATIATIANSTGEPPKKIPVYDPQKKVEGFSPDHGKHGKRGKKHEIDMKLEEIRNWILENKDTDDEISQTPLNEKISEYKLNTTEITIKLQKEGIIKYDNDLPGRWRVVTSQEPKKYTKDKKGLTLGEFEQKLRASWKKGTTTEFYEIIHENSDLDRKETSELVRKWLEDGIIVYDPEEFLVWVKGSTKSLSSHIEAKKKKKWICPKQTKFAEAGEAILCTVTNAIIDDPDQCTPECDLLQEES